MRGEGGELTRKDDAGFSTSTIVRPLFSKTETAHGLAYFQARILKGTPGDRHFHITCAGKSSFCTFCTSYNSCTWPTHQPLSNHSVATQ